MYTGPVVSSPPPVVANTTASYDLMPSAHGPFVSLAAHCSPVASVCANGWLFSKSKIWPQIVCLPAAGGGQASRAEQPPAPVPMHVVTPMPSTSSAVEPGSHTVGGNSGTHCVPRSSVNGPHVALPTVTPAGTHTPLFSVVPSP